MWADAIEFCKLSQKSLVPHRQQIFLQKEQRLQKMTNSASELTYFICQMLTVPSKNEFQAILNQNDIEKRMTIVGALLNKELLAKRAQKEKMEALNKKIKDRLAGKGGGDMEDDGKDEVTELQAKLKSLDLPEEAQKIAD